MVYYERIKALRENSPLSQKKMAEYLNIAQNTYSQYENGTRQMPIHILIEICRYFNVSSDYILGLSDTKSASTLSVPQYHPSYTQEDNLSLYNYIENASEKQLSDDIIWSANNLYSDNQKEKIKEVLIELIHEIVARYQTYEKYTQLNRVISLWSTYKNDLNLYYEALNARIVYQKFKKNTYDKNTSSFNDFLSNKGNKNTYLDRKGEKRIGGKHMDNNNWRYRDDETIRRFIFNEDAKNAVKFPHRPPIIHEQIVVSRYTCQEALEKLGKESLKQLLNFLILSACDDSSADTAPIMIRLYTRRYYQQDHKITQKAFTCPLPTIKDMEMKYPNQQKKLQELKEDCSLLRKNILSLKRQQKKSQKNNTDQ